MKRIKLFLALSVLAILLCGISSCSKEESDKPNTEQPDPEPTPEPTPEPAPEPDDYKLASRTTTGWKRLFGNP